jgi:hypothetical protein
MRRHLIQAALAVLFLISAASAAQAQYYDRGYYDRGYGQPYVQPYAQPNPYDHPRAYRGYDPYGYDPYDGQRAQGYRGLRVLEAWYGSRRRVCDASHALRSHCDGRPNCQFKVGNELCGDPLPGVVKGITITYSCHGQTRRVEEMESRHTGLRCD